ncbi:hypothetical protein Agub_g1601 [Astrephomene gubernaculifera]|uniref:CBM20 domain-containing protein n=1 Tax=Astrephomene gubernaculifera TaxID=47775 RepID=A0AAD3HHN6_9CHLO|nr:hypothetical protein Agub_g1601 [Astrephomene gubernaculifera]
MLTQRQMLRPQARSYSCRRPVKCFASASVTTVARPTQTASEAPIEVDVEALNKRLEARAKAMIQLEEQEVATRTKVKFILKQRVGLGESWKMVGKCPELGSMVPEVAPYMQWNNGDVWTYEAKIRPGTFTYKAVLRKPDGQYLWEDGKDRTLEVPVDAPAMEVDIANVRFP